MGEVRAYNGTTNITLQDTLLMTLGPDHLSNGVLIPITVLFVCVLLIGVFGNVAVCKKIIGKSVLKTATNYYLLSMAISNLMLLLICLPTQLRVCWQKYPWSFGVVPCKLYAFLCEMSSCASVLATVAFSVERYLVICHPARAYAMSGLRYSKRAIALLWIVSIIGTTPFGVFTTVNYIDFPPGSNEIVPESAYCGMFVHNIPPHWPLYELSCLLFFLIPMFVIIFLYVQIGRKIRMKSLERSVDGTVYGENNQSQARMSIIRTIFSVVAIFFIFRLLVHTERLLQVYGIISAHNPQIKELLQCITEGLCYIETTLIYIFYHLLSVRYRKVFRRLHFRNKTEQKSRLSATTLKQRQGQRTIAKSAVKTSTAEEVIITIAPTPEDRSRIQRKVATSSDPGPCTESLEMGVMK